MKNTQPNLKTSEHQSDLFVAAASSERLELFAEELPVQHDLRPGACFGCIATAACATGGGSTFSTLSSMSSL